MKKSHSDALTILSTSDIHLGNKRISIQTICMHLAMYIFPRLPKTKLLLLGGDIFDMMLPFSDENSNVIVSFIIDLLTLCSQHGVVVRVLRGTYSHDRDQCAIFKTLYEKGNYTNSFRYFDIMGCEYIEELKLKVLYIPDDLPYSSSDVCMVAIRKLLDDMGWDKVDYVFGHGYFDHMLPPHVPHVPKVCFRVEQFKDIVRRYVLFGHVHFCNITDMVIFNGSFERLAHGEEEPKGFIYITDDSKNASIEFIENKHAIKFITLDMTEYETAEEAILEYQAQLEKYKDDPEMYVRVIHPSSEIRNILFKITKQGYPRIKYSHNNKATNKTNALSLRISDILNFSDLPIPDPRILPDMVYDFLNMNDKCPLSKDTIKILLENI